MAETVFSVSRCADPRKMNRRTTVSIGSGATAASHSVAVRRRGLRDSGRELWQVVVSGAERGSGAWVGSG
ncbi:hypothetical protein, partial [Nocardia cyriacigeorgica]|uniref:hypothetical protein n=1 Tax=Nocardia cyriacigeorgica TaxID=135487 RepID=UPI001CA4F66B